MKRKFLLSIAFIKVLFLILSFLSSHVVLSQQNAPASAPVQKPAEEEDDDDQQKRVEWELLITMDPATKKIPAGIRKKELRYVRAMTSGLQRKSPLQNLSTSLYTAAGSITENFRTRGPYNLGGRSRALGIDILNEQHLIAGGVSGGLWSSENQGRTWTRRSSLSTNPAITDIAQDTRNGHERTWYYCTGEYMGNSSEIPGNGVFKSTDNGVTWLQLESTNQNNPQDMFGDKHYYRYMQNLEIHPVTGDIYIATWDGILKSTDGGITFTLVLSGNNNDYGAHDVHITSTGVLYASIPDEFSRTTHDGIYRSTTGNSGAWTRISPAGFPTRLRRSVIGSAPSNSNVLYILAADTNPDLSGSAKNDIWKYTYSSGNGSGAGGRWDNRSANIPDFGAINDAAFNSQGGYDLLVKVHPGNENTVFIGGTSLYRSTDGFATSRNSTRQGGYMGQNLYPNHHADQHVLLFFNSNPARALSGCDGGIFLTGNMLAASVEWTSLNNGYLTTQSYAVSVGPNNTIMSGFQDQSTWLTYSNDGQASWSEIGGGDGCGNAFSKDGVFAFISAPHNVVARRQFTSVNDTLKNELLSLRETCPDHACNFVTTFALDPNNEDILYLPGNKTLWRNNHASSGTSDDGWTEITNTQTAAQITAAGVSVHPAHVVYIGTRAGEIFRIDNAHTGNPTGVNVYSDKGMPGNGDVSKFVFVNCLAVDPRDANRVLAVFSNYNIKSIFLTTDGGNTWSDVSGNLEQNADGTGNGPSVRWLTMVGANAETYLAGTSTGMYSTSTLNGTQTIWTQVAAATIGNAVVTQIKARDSDGLVLVGSHGNGLFSGHYQVSPAHIQAVKNPMEITVFSNASPTQIQTSELFTSTAPTTSPITLSVVSNSGNSTVTTAVSNGILTLTYARDKTGDVTVVVKGTDANSNFINTSVVVHIIAARSEQTITFYPIQKRTYKDPVIYLRATSNSGLPITYSSHNTSTASVAGNVVTIGNVGSARITATQAGNEFYRPATAVQQSLEVGRLRQIITFPVIPARPLGTADFAPGATTTSSSAITYRSGNAAVATIVEEKIHITGVGTSVITASAVADANYDAATDMPQTLTVSKRVQVIAFPAIPVKPFGTADFEPGAMTSSSSIITYRSENAAVATIVDGKIHITGVGSSVITASAVADANYNAAVDMTQTLTVSKGVQVITFPAISAKTFGTADFEPRARTNSSSIITYRSENAAVATIVAGKIHITGVGTSVITASAVADANYNAAVDMTQTLTVSKGVQVITFPAISAKTFGTADFEPRARTNSSSIITYRSENAAVATIVDGKIHITGVGSSAITASAMADANYEAAADMTQTLTVSKGVQVITFPAISAKTFGTADFEPRARTNSSSIITYRSENAAVATIVDGKIHITGVGSSAITASAMADANYEAAADMTQTLTVSKGVQVITFPAISVKTFGTADFELGATTNSSSTITYRSENAAVATIVAGKIHITGVGSSVITASAVADANYEAAANMTQTLTVSKRVQVITFPAISAKTFGTADFEPGAMTSSSSTITYRSENAAVATIVDGKIHITGVGSSGITASAVADVNYNAAANMTQTLTVSKGVQVITFPAISAKTFGTADFELGATTSSSSIITYSSENAAVATIVDGKIHITGVGSSVITASAVADVNYEAAANMTQTLTVSKGVQVITFPPISAKTFGTADFEPGAMTSSSSTITYRSENAAVATIVDGKIHITGVGSSGITASAVADANYNAAADMTQTLTVSKGVQVITFPAISVKTFGTADFKPGAMTSSSSIITYRSENAAVATIVDGKIHITGVGSSGITASAVFDANYNAAADMTQTLTVSKGVQVITFPAISVKTFGTADFEPGAMTSSSSIITYRSENAAVATIVDGKIHITGVGSSGITASAVFDANYNAAADMTQTLTVSKGVQVITFPAISAKTFGTADFEPRATTNSSSIITYSSENAAVATIVDGKIHITGVGSSGITASAVFDANYNAAADMTQTLTVSKGVQVITFPAISAKTFGTADFEPRATTNSSSIITYSSENAAVATIVDGEIHITGVGSSVITASAAADENYEAATDVQQTLRVTASGKKIQIITFPAISARPFGTADFSPEATTHSSSVITYTSGNTMVATIVNEKIHITGVGNSTITASAVADANYDAAADVQQTLIVSKAAQTISIEVPALTAGGDSYIATPTGGASGNPVVLSSTSAKVFVSGFTIAPVQAGMAQISATQSGNANYLEAAASVNFCVNPQKPVITKIAYNMLLSGEATGNQWFLDKAPIAGATSQTLLATKSGNYSATTTIEGCVSLHSEPLVYTGDVSKPQGELTIYPNPANSQLYVVLGGFDIHSEAGISIYSLVGISFFNKTFMGSKIVTISTSFLQNGAYIILVVQGDKRRSKLFFKH